MKASSTITSTTMIPSQDIVNNNNNTSTSQNGNDHEGDAAEVLTTTKVTTEASYKYSMEARTSRINQRYDKDGARLVAGLVPLSNDKRKVLLIESTNKKGWVLPKGGWERDEELAEAACREAWEEAGVKTLTSRYRYLDTIQDQRPPEEIKTSKSKKLLYHFFEVCVDSEEIAWPEQASRNRRWFSYEDAKERMRGRPELLDALGRSSIERTADPSVPFFATRVQPTRATLIPFTIPPKTKTATKKDATAASAAATVSTPPPLKSHAQVCATKTASGRIPLTPSPGVSRNTSLCTKEIVSIKSDQSSLTPSPVKPAPSKEEGSSSSTTTTTTTKTVPTSVYGNGNLTSRFKEASSSSTSLPSAKSTRSRSRSRRRPDDASESHHSAKAKASASTEQLELGGVSDWTLSGSRSTTTGKQRKENRRQQQQHQTQPSRESSPPPKPKSVAKKKESQINLRSTSSKASSRVPQAKKADRFIPNRAASEGLVTVGSGKPDESQHQRHKHNSSSSVLATAASAYDVGGGRAQNTDDLANALEGLGIEDGSNNNNDDSSSSYSREAPDAIAYKSTLADACDISLNTRILSFKPPAPESSKPIDLRAQYNRPLKKSSQGAQFRRKIQTAPERVLDAPGLVDDYYLNLLDWSSGNQVAIGLERNVYVWSADSGSVDCLLETPEDTFVTSVKWSEDGAHVAVGLGTGEVQIWDVEEGTKLRSMYGHDTRVGVMGWNKHLLSTGARSGLVFNHDVRIAQHKVAELSCHTAEVCGLDWRSDGAQLATGGNDNIVAIWDARSLAVPKFTKTNHRAAVKALGWCPWQNNLLATGGGSYDRHIHFWNTTSGARTNSIDTGSQVTSLRWSTHYKELVSSSGFPDNSLSIWSYPSLVRNVEIPAHETRVLHTCLSPDGQMLATTAADESLKFWKIFERKAGASTSSHESGVGSKAQMSKQMTIR